MSKKRKHQDHDEHIDESWLIPYADILTLLLALFIVLYSMNSVDVKKFEDMSRAFSFALNNGSGVLDMPSVIRKGDETEKDDKQDDKEDSSQQSELSQEELIRQEQAELNKLKEEMDTYISENGLDSALETELNMSQLLITISDSALFAPAQARVNTEGTDLAVAISKLLEQYPSYDVIIAGHTDDRPINNAQFRSNWDLSTMRAVRFLDILLKNDKLEPERFSAIGYGEYHPIADNATEEGKAKNRRVEVSIIHTFVDKTNPQNLQVKKP
ncbi:flagellar motor protein MotB [Paenibacillus sp. J5C_2022]|uniref:flagellar motor protein MotB n=1 Tax=Paenibacillus sp. J5C2022 TaxID=2977129 RepID=UPI0021D1A93F|nr:flagellar motor protein MotB [Paenibacillus sp. J5C2022]MCU6708556.1 flagellar motor protein MotB [Paenibacillus sp. J5C2022]